MPDTTKPATSSNNPSSDLHLQFLSWAVEHHLDFDFAYFKANMMPSEYERYRKETVKAALRFIADMAKS
jgi:hypothetical protein